MASTISAGTTAGTAVAITGDTSGDLALLTQNGANTITVPNGTGTMAVNGVSSNIVSGTTVTCTTQTNVDFIGIPSWAKKITIMFNGISLNNARGATDSFAIQLGTVSGIETSGYTGSVTELVNGSAASVFNVTARFSFAPYTAANALYYGSMVLANMGSNAWTCTSILSGNAAYNATGLCAASKTTSGTLDRLRFTTTNGTDVIDAGTINILYE